MKKLLALAMALTLCLGLAACGGTPAEDPADENTPQTETSGETVTLRVGATPAPHQEILEQVVDTLAAQGITEVDGIYHIERGYEDLVGKLAGVGAEIQVVTVPDEESQSQAV